MALCSLAVSPSRETPASAPTHLHTGDISQSFPRVTRADWTTLGPEPERAARPRLLTLPQAVEPEVLCLLDVVSNSTDFSYKATSESIYGTKGSYWRRKQTQRRCQLTRWKARPCRPRSAQSWQGQRPEARAGPWPWERPRPSPLKCVPSQPGNPLKAGEKAVSS